jgi:hypothetical protein
MSSFDRGLETLKPPAPSVVLDATVFAGRPSSRAQRLGGHTALGADADPTPDGCRTHLDRRPNDDGFIASKDCLVLLLKLTVNREGLELRAITSKLDAPVGRRFRLDNGGGGLRLCD